MSSTSSLQPESINPDDLQRLVPIKNTLTKADVWGKRINLQILDKTGVQQELGKIFGVKPADVAIVEILGPDAAPLKNPDGRMLLIPSEIGPHCTIEIKSLQDSKIVWEADKKFVIEKSVGVEITPGDRRAIVIVIGI